MDFTSLVYAGEIKKNVNYRKKLLFLIAISTACRIFFAASLELGNAEVYYRVLAGHLQWNYFDHPPLVAWLIRLTTANLYLDNELFIRLGAIICAALCTWLVFKLGRIMHSPQAGWYAALLYTASIYGSILAGTLIQPDSPLMLFWFSGMLVLTKIFHADVNDRQSTRRWCLFGVLAGLCIMSKVNGVFLWIGTGLFVFAIDRSCLKHPGIYISAAITAFIISPILIWNLQHQFISYTYHSDRVSITGAGIHIGNFLKDLLAVIVIVNPVNFFLICSALLWVIKGKLPAGKKDILLILFCSIPMILATLFVSLFRETQSHWPGPAYTTLLMLPAIQWSSIYTNKKSNIPVLFKWALACTIIYSAGEMLITHFFPGTLSEQKQDLNMGAGDITLDMYGWKEAGHRFDSLYRTDTAKHLMPSGAPIMVTNWFPAAHIDFYMAAQTKQETIGVGNIFQLHEYYWMNQYKKPLKNGDSAYYIVPSNLFDPRQLDEVLNHFDSHEMALVIAQQRNGMVCRQIYIFRARGYRQHP